MKLLSEIGCVIFYFFDFLNANRRSAEPLAFLMLFFASFACLRVNFDSLHERPPRSQRRRKGMQPDNDALWMRHPLAVQASEIARKRVFWYRLRLHFYKIFLYQRKFN